MGDPILDRIKAWAFPAMITFLATIIYNDLQQIKTDIRTLMQHSSADDIRIQNLERQVFGKQANLPYKPVKDKSAPFILLLAECVLPKDVELEEEEYI